MIEKHNPAMITFAQVNSNFNHTNVGGRTAMFLGSIVDCTWHTWGTWETCSVNCGSGTQERKRTKVAAQHGGTDCAGNDTETQFCCGITCPGG